MDKLDTSLDCANYRGTKSRLGKFSGAHQKEWDAGKFWFLPLFSIDEKMSFKFM